MLRSDPEKQIHHGLFLAVQRLRGRIDVSSFKNYLLTIIFLRQASLVFSRRELCENLENLDLGVHVPAAASFNNLFDQRNRPGNGERIDNALRIIETSNGNNLHGLFGSIRFGNSKFGTDDQSDEILREILEALGPNDSTLPAEVLAREVESTAWMYDSAIEYFAELEGKIGEDFATPRGVGELLCRFIKPHPHETVYDPASGTGSLLVAAAEAARKNFGALPAQVFGQETNASTCSLARMNLFIHGVRNHGIAHGDTLLSPAFTESGYLRQFDVVLSHPPFQTRWNSKKADSGPFRSRFRYGVPPDGKADYAFILHMLASLKPETGRMCVIVSHGVLFRGGVEGAIREALVKDNLLDAVVGLPPKLFYNTGIPAAVLVFKKNRPTRQRSILFINAVEEFRSGRNQNRLDERHVDKIARTYEAYEGSAEFSRLVSFDEISANDFSLSVQRYFQESSDAELTIDLGAIRAERLKVSASIRRMEEEIAGLIGDLGLNSQQ